MKAVRVLRCSFPLIAAIAIVAISGCDAAPSDAVVRLKQVFAERPVVADADNAFLDVFGFTAVADEDAHALGARRVAWLEKFHVDPKTAGADPGKPLLDMKAHRSQAYDQVIEACRAAIARACGSALERVKSEAPLSDIEPLLLARYDALLGRSGWFEIGATYANAPLPSYEGPIEAQRLMLIRLRNVAAAGDAAKVRATLSRDLAYWRMVLASSDLLISKMIALAAIRQHFALGSHVLRDLVPDRVMEAIPAQWREEFSDGERSMLRPLAGELVLAEAMLGDDEDSAATMTRLDGPVNRAARQKNQKPSLREVADYYLSAAEGYRAPLREYEAVSVKLRSKHARSKHARSKLSWDVSQYALRVGSAEGMRRAALLTAELRRQSVPVAMLPDRLKDSPLRNPYTGQPFDWDAADQAIVFIGPEQRDYKRQAYLY